MPSLQDLRLFCDLNVLDLTTTGRITGAPRQIELWFALDDCRLYVLAEHSHNTQWVKNIIREKLVRVRLGRLEFEAEARLLDSDRDRDIRNRAQQLFLEKYGWGDGLPVEITPL